MLRIPGQRLFPGRTGVALANNVLNRLYTKLCDEAEITRITSHGAGGTRRGRATPTSVPGTSR
jgi:hypothetical protein